MSSTCSCVVPVVALKARDLLFHMLSLSFYSCLFLFPLFSLCVPFLSFFFSFIPPCPRDSPPFSFVSLPLKFLISFFVRSTLGHSYRGQMAESLQEKRQMGRMGSNGSIPGPRALFEQEVVARLLLGSQPILRAWLIYKIATARKNKHKRRESRMNINSTGRKRTRQKQTDKLIKTKEGTRKEKENNKGKE